MYIIWNYHTTHVSESNNETLKIEVSFYYDEVSDRYMIYCKGINDLRLIEKKNYKDQRISIEFQKEARKIKNIDHSFWK